MPVIGSVCVSATHDASADVCARAVTGTASPKSMARATPLTIALCPKLRLDSMLSLELK